MQGVFFWWLSKLSRTKLPGSCSLLLMLLLAACCCPNSQTTCQAPLAARRCRSTSETHCSVCCSCIRYSRPRAAVACAHYHWGERL